jgi:hypothetical protein
VVNHRSARPLVIRFFARSQKRASLDEQVIAVDRQSPASLMVA